MYIAKAMFILKYYLMCLPSLSLNNALQGLQNHTHLMEHNEHGQETTSNLFHHEDEPTLSKQPDWILFINTEKTHPSSQLPVTFQTNSNIHHIDISSARPIYTSPNSITTSFSKREWGTWLPLCLVLGQATVSTWIKHRVMYSPSAQFSKCKVARIWSGCSRVWPVSN